MNEHAMFEQVEAGFGIKAAPMPLLAVQAFANTLDLDEATDRLDSLASWREWLEGSDLVAPGVRLRSEHLRTARELRDLIRELLAANEEGDPAGEQTGRLAKLIRADGLALAAGPEGELELDLAPARSGAALSAQLLGIVYEAQLNGTWARLKLCENSECAWAFYDSSRNRSGSWCRMGVCGNRLKNRAYRARQRGS